MDSSQFEQKPIQLVYATPEGKYEMNPAAELFLSKIPKPLAVVSVAGLYRTGKSYLLNRILLNRNNGFGVGPTINPCTKGLWCWGVPLKGTTADGQKINILIIDSEGIGALDEDQNHDIKIFTLAILTSSIFIYNSVGSIDENALQNLSMVVNLTKNIQINTQDNDEEDPQDLARYFPTFFWVVRDFSLQLISSEGETLTPKDYLQRALAPQKGFSDDVDQKNRIRRLLTAFFKDRECATLVRPLVNEQKLQHLYQCSFEDLRPEFVEQALNLRKKVLTNAKPKMIKGEYLDGTMYVSMINSYLIAINNGGVPNIQNAWTYMCIEKCMKLQQQCYDFFTEKTDEAFRDNFPCSVGEFEGEIENIQKECFQMFESEQIGDESKSYLQELKGKIKEKTNILRIENERESINFLKNYIIKNFSVIQKKMKMNQYQNFQEYLKSINNFYLYLVDSGPDLPKREIVYLDFLKKVTTQGAEIFLKHTSQNLQSLKCLSLEKQMLLKQQNQELKAKLKGDMEKHRVKLDTIFNEKLEWQKRMKEVDEKYENLLVNSRSEVAKLESNYENKVKVVQIKLGQTTLHLQDMKEKKEALQTSYIFQKKEREKEKALAELKFNQFKDQLKSLKIKEKNQQVYISELNLETNNKLKQSALQFDKKVNELSSELHRIKQMYNQTIENKEELENKLKIVEKNGAVSSKKYQQDLRAQIDKFENFKNEVQSGNELQITKLQTQNEKMQANLTQLSTQKIQSEKQLRELSERIKSTTSQSQKQIAILTQKIQFLNHQASEAQQKFNSNLQYYEGMLKSQNQMKEQQLRKIYKAQFNQMDELHLSKINQLETQLTSTKEKHQQETATGRQTEEKYKFQFQLENKRFQSQIRNQAMIIQNLEEERKKLYAEKQELLKQMDETVERKQSYYQEKIAILENELQIALQRANEEHSQLSNKSEQSLKQLKNYYELEKENVLQRLTNQKEKYEKRISKMRDQYENQLNQQRKTTEQEYQNLKDECNNEAAMLKELIINLQHDNDSKSKTLQNTEIRYQQIKERLEKKEVDFGNKVQSLLKSNSQEKQALQQKIMESNDQRSKLQREIMLISHQKDQTSKEIKELAAKYEIKVEEIFYLNKNIEKVNSDSRQKLNDLSNQYMNERLNYQKKIALGQQQKEFYYKKIEDYQKDQVKSSTTLEQLSKKLTNNHQEEMRVFEQRRSADYAALQSKYQKLKKSSKQNEQQTSKNISELEKHLALEQQRYSNLLERYEQLEQKRLNDGNNFTVQLTSTKQLLSNANKSYLQELVKLKKDLTDAVNDRNQIQVLYERDKILLENKNTYLEETKQKNKKEYLQKIKNLEQTIENIQKNRANDKNYYQTNHSENVMKLEKKYNSIIQQNHQNWTKKERQYESSVKQLQMELRNINERTGRQLQAMSQSIRTQQRRVRQLQDNEKRALSQLQKYKTYKQTSSSQNISMFERERDNLKQKMQQKQEKYKNVQKAKQQMYLIFQSQKAKWNLERQNCQQKQDELKQKISKQEKDLEKLFRENQKMKAQKKCNKNSGQSGFSRYPFERGNSKYSRQDSNTSISMSTSKQNCNPLGQLLFFNNQ